MKILGIEHTPREVGYLCLVLLLTIAVFITIYAGQQDVKEYKVALAECMNNFELEKSGAYDLWGNPLINISNISINLPTK